MQRMFCRNVTHDCGTTVMF